MKKLAIALSVLGLWVGIASAADLEPRYTKAPPGPASYNWTGCYVGGHGGAGSMHDSFSNLNSSIGALGGGQLGCNYQIGMLVLGIEGEGWWSGIRADDNFSQASFGDTFTGRNRSDYDVAARFGLAFDKALIYGKAGWLGGRFDFSLVENRPVIETGNATLNGLLVGLGLEYAISAPWTVKFEYDHLAFSPKTIAFACLNCAPFAESVSASKDIFKLGFNYNFYK